MPRKDEYSIEVVSAKVGEVVATATFPNDSRNYHLVLSSDPFLELARYEVYRVLQDFNGWVAPQPIKFTDAGVPLFAGAYTLALRERYQCRKTDMCWRTLAETTVWVDEVTEPPPPPNV